MDLLPIESTLLLLLVRDFVRAVRLVAFLRRPVLLVPLLVPLLLDVFFRVVDRPLLRAVLRAVLLPPLLCPYDEAGDGVPLRRAVDEVDLPAFLLR